MLKPESLKSLPVKCAEDRRKYRLAVAEEVAAKDENFATSREIALKLKTERKVIANLIAQLRAARETAGVSLNELEIRTGIQKSSLSRLENSAAPDPTMLTLHRYAVAIGLSLKIDLICNIDKKPGN